MADGGAPTTRGTGDGEQGIERWIQPIASAAGAAAGVVVVVVLLGGIVMWLRFRKADLPADQAVAFMPRSQMMSVGLRLIVLPAIVSGAVAATVVWADKHRTTRKVLRAFCTVVVAVLALMLPLTWASVTWAALLLVIIYWWRGFGAERRPPHEHVSRWRLAAVAVLAAAIISLGRQIDQPVQLLQATLTMQRGPAISGVFVSADATAVYVGNTTTHTIDGVRRDDVRTLALGPPLERAPSPSLLSALFFHNRWSVTPLRWWCNGESYSWSQLGELCRTQPKPFPDDRRQLDIRWIPVRVTCPKSATDGCVGYLRLRTRETYSRALGPYATPRQVAFPRDALDAVPFSIPPQRTRDVCVPTSIDERALLRAKSDSRRDPRKRPVPLDVILSGDPRGDSVLSRTTMQLDVGPAGEDPSLILGSSCSAGLRHQLAAQKARPATARAVSVLDGHALIVQGRGPEQLVSLLGIDSPATPAFAKPACGEREGVDRLLRLVFTHPVDANGDGLVDRPGGRARTLRLVADPGQPSRDSASLLLRYVRVAGAHETLQEAMLRSGWATPVKDVGQLALGRRLQRAALLGDLASTNLATACAKPSSGG